MIAVAVLLVVNFLVFCQGGLVLYSLSGKKEFPSVTLVTLSGIIGINLLVCFLHFFIPVGALASAIVLGLLATGYLFFRKSHTGYYREWLTRLKLQNKTELGLFILMGAVLAFNTASRPQAFDAGSYHFQAIQWNEAYAIVPGLANLIRQLGFNSSWYILQAFSGFAFAGSESVYTLNGLLLLLFIGYLIPEASEKATLKIYKLITVVCCLILAMGKYAGEVTADLPVILLLSWTFLLVLQKELKQPEADNIPGWLIFMLPVYLITIKISAVPVLLVSLYFWIKQTTATKIKYMLLAVLFVVTWLIGNIILTGYLVFPFGGINLFDVDWKVPELLIRDENYSITGWGRGPHHPVEVMATMPFNEWFPIWLREQKLYNWIFVLVLLALVAITRKKITVHLHQTAPRLLLATVVFGLIFWFVNVPDFRFVYGYLIPVLCAAGSLFFVRYTSIFSSKTNLLRIAFFVFTCLAGGVLLFIRLPHITPTIWLKPASYPKPELTQIALPTGHQINVATWEQKCWNTPLPCTCEYYSGLQLRGETLQQGFRIKE